MPNRNVSIVVLCEDTQQDVFIRQWLESKGMNSRKFRVLKSSGLGSGEQFVRTCYPGEVKELRRVNTHRPFGVSLVTMMDADNYTVQERHDSLNNALVQDGQTRRTDDEKIAILIPKRNIETWVHYLQGENVDEINVYRKLDKAGDCQVYVERFAESASDSPLKVTAPESLQMAMAEMERII